MSHGGLLKTYINVPLKTSETGTIKMAKLIVLKLIYGNPRLNEKGIDINNKPGRYNLQQRIGCGQWLSVLIHMYFSVLDYPSL